MARFYRCDVCGDEYDNDSHPTHTPLWGRWMDLCSRCADVGSDIVQERDDDIVRLIKERIGVAV